MQVRADKVGDVYGLFRRHKVDLRQAVETCTNPNLRRPVLFRRLPAHEGVDRVELRYTRLLVQVKHTQQRSCLCDSKISKLDSPRTCQEDVLGLNISVQDLFPVEVLHRKEG